MRAPARGALGAAVVLLHMAAPLPARAQVNDFSGRSGTLSSRIEAALRAASTGREGSRFRVVFGFEGLVPSDVQAGGGGGMVLQRYDSWSMTGFSGLLPVADAWNRPGRAGTVIDLATMQTAAALPAPVLQTRSLLAFLEGRVREGRARLEGVSIRLPQGRLALGERPLWWLGRIEGGEVYGWLDTSLRPDVAGEQGGLRRDLTGLLSTLPGPGGVLERLTQLASGDPDLDVRRAAVRYLGRRPEETRPILQRLFRDASDEQLRMEAMTGLLVRMEQGQVSWLAEVARTDPSLRLRREAIAELGRSGDPQARRILEEIVGIGRP